MGAITGGLRKSVVPLLAVVVGGMSVIGPETTRAQSIEIVPPFTVTTPDSVILEVEFTPAYHQDSIGKPVVVLLHMLSRNRGSWTKFIEEMSRQGIDVLAYDARGHGHSVTRRETRYEYTDFTADDYARMVDDLGTILDAVRDPDNAKNLNAQVLGNKVAAALQRADWNHLAIVGASIGSSAALLYAAGHPDVDAVALLSPGLDYRGLKTEPAMTEYGKRPLFIAAGQEDAYSWRSSLALDSLTTSVEKTFWKSSSGKHGTDFFAADSTFQPALAKFLADVLVWAPLKEKVRKQGK